MMNEVRRKRNGWWREWCGSGSGFRGGMQKVICGLARHPTDRPVPRPSTCHSKFDTVCRTACHIRLVCLDHTQRCLLMFCLSTRIKSRGSKVISRLVSRPPQHFAVSWKHPTESPVRSPPIFPPTGLDERKEMCRKLWKSNLTATDKWASFLGWNSRGGKAIGAFRWGKKAISPNLPVY